MASQPTLRLFVAPRSARSGWVSAGALALLAAGTVAAFLASTRLEQTPPQRGAARSECIQSRC